MPNIPPNQAITSPQRAAANSDYQDDSIDLARIAGFVQRNWGTLVICVLLALACGAALFAALPSRWQALTTIEIGQSTVGNACKRIARVRSDRTIHAGGRTIEATRIDEHNADQSRDSD